jgi:hypothetical protein
MNDAVPTAEPNEILIRTYVQRVLGGAPVQNWTGAGRTKIQNPAPSEYVLIFDCETTVDDSQRLRFGAYQLRRRGVLSEAGLFFAASLPSDEQALLQSYAEQHGMVFRPVAEFVEKVFYGTAYRCRAQIIGFNLPFDLSRIAIRASPAKGEMRGGFSLRLSDHKWYPPVQVKHGSQRFSLIRFAAPPRQRSSEAERKRGVYVGPRRGFFVDVNTFAAALLSRPFTLDGLCEHLEVESRKLETHEHGGPLTEDYIAYGVRDVQATWECFVALQKKYQAFGLSTEPSAIYTEASLGKAYLRAMNLKGWRSLQPEFPSATLGAITSAYYGGRSEVRRRRELVQVELCDFLSMYPTVCSLMGLWRFVTAQKLISRDGTAEVRAHLATVTLASLKDPAQWPSFTAIVQVQPDADLFPVRAVYDDAAQATIGLNHLSSEEGLWFTLPDCLASMILTGRAPKVLRAIIFEPGPPQPDMTPVKIAGEETYLIDPYAEDFFRRLIELRQQVKREAAGAKTDRARTALDVRQNALKIAANATSYGVYAEINVKEQASPKAVEVQTPFGSPFLVETENVEEPGPFYHPLLAALITGAARLMLAVTERLVGDAGLDWAFCDTDSMAIAKPTGMVDDEFRARVTDVVAWFEPLNPYSFAGSILKVEDYNFDLETRERRPLFCWAVSAKRYALFNVSPDGEPIIRKASAHGLGHLRAPYGPDNPATSIPVPLAGLDKVGVSLWQHDLWVAIARAALAGTPDHLNLSYHPALALPAVSRYAATTPPLHNWFKAYNHGRSYEEQVKPFNFLLAFFADPFFESATGSLAPFRPVGPFDRNAAEAAGRAFDRETGEPIPRGALVSVERALAQYHLHPESKFLNGDHLARGRTERRHVRVTSVRHIGKEANRLEEQLHLGINAEAQPDYGHHPDEVYRIKQRIRGAMQKLGKACIAKCAGISRNKLDRMLRPEQSSLEELARLEHAAAQLFELEREARGIIAELRREVAENGLRAVARDLGEDPSNLGKRLKRG